jgi:predicted ArsR family transcriptional regulator
MKRPARRDTHQGPAQGPAGPPRPDRQRPTSVQRQARALGDPTRHAIFCSVAEAPEPVDVATLTEQFGLNHNAIRQHLAKLCDAGLLLEERGAPAGPGRPRLLYRLAPDAAGAWGTPSPYEQLALVLLEVLRSGRRPRDVGAQVGRRIAADLPDAADPVHQLEVSAARQGFEPRRSERGSSLELVLGRCAYQAAASSDPDVVCALHRGLAEGIAEAIGGGLEVTNLIVRNPNRGGCRLQLHRMASEPHPTRRTSSSGPG